MSVSHVPEVLRLRYLASLPGKAGEFEQALADALTSTQPDWSMIRSLGHKLAGSAGMYGFDQLGDIARDLVHMIDDRSGPSEAVQARTLALIAALRRNESA